MKPTTAIRKLRKLGWRTFYSQLTKRRYIKDPSGEFCTMGWYNAVDAWDELLSPFGDKTLSVWDDPFLLKVQVEAVIKRNREP